MLGLSYFCIPRDLTLLVFILAIQSLCWGACLGSWSHYRTTHKRWGNRQKKI